MTIQTAQRYLKAYEEGMNNPFLTSAQREQLKKNYVMMKEHIEKDRKPLLKEESVESKKAGKHGHN
jgi:hypothetical protein